MTNEDIMMTQSMPTVEYWLDEALTAIEDHNAFTSKMTGDQKATIIAAMLTAASNDQLAMTNMHINSTLDRIADALNKDSGF